MAITQNTYTGDGSTVLFSFTFPYLETTDIKVSLDGSDTTAYTLANATTIQFNTAPTNGAAIRIYRVTDDAALASQFYPGSAIRSQDLNDNFTQNLYVTQESNREATTAITTANGAVTTADAATATAIGAVSTANAATATANQAASDATAAVSTANTASSNASAAVVTANTASTNASAAVSTANSAATDAATAISTSNGAVTTANSAATDAATAIATANSAAADAATAITTANGAVATANTASTNATNAVTTANTADTNASSAVSTANTALNTANTAAAAVANAILYSTIANVAAIPASPSNNDAVEVVDATGIESLTPLTGVPAGFVGDAGLSVRLVYSSAGSTWTWIQYFPNDPDDRYAGPNTNTGSAANPAIAFGPSDPNTGIFSPGADELALVTGGVVQLSVDAAGNVDVAGTASASNLYAQSNSIVDGALVLRDTVDNTKSVSFLPTSGATVSTSYTVPSADGTSGQLLSTDGSGNLSWTNPVDISGKLDSTTAASTYLTIADAGTTYQTQAGMSSYLTNAAASSTYETQYTVTTTATSKTLVNRERCTITAATQTLTLPASPSAGHEVTITIGGAFTDTVIARNGSNIMSLAQDLTIDKADISVTLYYVDATRGWRII